MVELFTNYDTGARQRALALTNVGVTLVIIWLHAWLNRRGRRLSMIVIATVLAAIWLDALGNFQHFYASYWWWDRLTHGIGGLAASALFIDLYLNWRSTAAPELWRMYLWLGFLVGQFVSAMYEVSEWLGDILFNTHRVQGPFDSPRDLFFNLLGGLIAATLFVIARRWSRREQLLGDRKNGIV